MWGMKLALVMVGVLVMVPETMQLNMNHPVASAAQRLNLQYGPFIGLIISSPRDEKTLKNSSLFTPVNNMDSVLTYAGSILFPSHLYFITAFLFYSLSREYQYGLSVTFLHHTLFFERKIGLMMMTFT